MKVHSLLGLARFNQGLPVITVISQKCTVSVIRICRAAEMIV